MFNTSVNVGQMEEIDLSPTLSIPLLGRNWLGACLRSLKPDEGHTSEEHFILVLSSDCQSQKLEDLFVNREDEVLVRIHSECLFGDILGATLCDCGFQLEASLDLMLKANCGILIYLRQEGRGIGLYNKVISHNMPEHLDSFARQEALGFNADLRGYGTAIDILKILGVKKIKLLSGNKAKIELLKNQGFQVSTAKYDVDITKLSKNAQNELKAKIARGYIYEHDSEGTA
jgi:GTP cyclohydrolase II